MKKASRIIISILLIAAMIVPAAIFANAEVNVSTTPSKQGGEPYEYYNLKDGLYTKKTVSGPLDNGNYQVELEAYTSDVRYLTADKKGTIDIMVLMDNSNSMLGSKRTDAKNAIKTVFSNLVNNYGAGTKYAANVCLYTFSNSVTHRFGYQALTSDSLSSMNSKINAIAGNLFGGTNTGLAFKTVYEKIAERKGDCPNNTQVLFFLTDGVPSFGITGENSTFGGPGNSYANEAIKYDNLLKNMGVKIYCLGINSNFKAISSQTDDTLCEIITGGYKNDKNKGEKIGIREATVFLNILSSGWKISSDRLFNWKNYDNKQANKKIDDIIGIPYDNSQKSKRKSGIYNYWHQSDDSWQNIPSFYTQYIDTENPDTKYYYGNVSEEKAIAEALSEAVIYAISTHVVSEGALLGDYTIKDTVSNYFEVAQNSTKIYKVPYDYKNGSFIGGDTVNSSHQYGESNRKWGAPTDITDKIQYTENNNSVEVLASPENSSVIDTCVVDDIVDSSNEKHGGNKLRITFEIRPKDSFMGGSDVPTNIYKESGIFDKDGKAVQNFANLSATGILDTSSVPKLQVELVTANAHIDDDNVKIGYLYNLDDLGKKNLTLTYKGRYSNDEYTVKLKDSEYVVYDATGAEVKYSESKATDENPKSVDTKPDDYAEIIIGENHIDETLNNKGIVTNSKLIQFNSTGITRSGNTYSMQTPKVNKYVYLLWKGMKTSSIYINERFSEYNKTGKDSKATTLDGIVNGIRYFSGREAIRQLDTQFNVNVYVPTVKVSDAVVNSNKTYPVDSDTLSAAIDNYTIQNADDENTKNLINDQTLSSLVFAQADTSSNNEFILVDIGDNGLPKAVSSNTSFVNDAFSFNEAVNIKGYLKAFADSDGNAKMSGNAITNKDQLRFAISYVELNDKLNALNKDAPFKLTVDEFWATNECDVCKAEEKYVPQYLGYQAQVHKMITTDNITVRKTGCNASHTNGSFVFTVIGMNEKDGKPDLDSMKVLNNFTIQGNGQRTISVNTSAYKYFCVVEDLNALAIKEQEGTKNAELIKSGWTWDYTKNVTVNGTKWESIIKNAFTMDNGDGYSLTFNNEYNPNNSTLHYASAYATNTMSHDKVEVTTSPSNTTK